MLTSFSTALAVSGFLVGSCTSVCVLGVFGRHQVHVSDEDEGFGSGKEPATDASDHAGKITSRRVSQHACIYDPTSKVSSESSFYRQD